MTDNKNITKDDRESIAAFYEYQARFYRRASSEQAMLKKKSKSKLLTEVYDRLEDEFLAVAKAYDEVADTMRDYRKYKDVVLIGSRYEAENKARHSEVEA